jgi:dTDP-L-rhamnose 4-epimerase
MPISVLVTGGAGFIGTALGKQLVERGYHVTALDSLHPQVHGRGRSSMLDPAIDLLTWDIAQAGTWESTLKMVEPEILVHLAAETGTGQSLTQASRHAEVNVLGTARMLDAFTAAGMTPHHFVLASSRAVYGEGRWQAGDTVFYAPPRSHDRLVKGQWNPVGPSGKNARPLPSIARETEPHPTSVYAATKLAQENMLSAWTAAVGASLSILRLQNVYGPGQSLSNPYTGVLALFGRLVTEGKTVDVYEDGRMLRDFVFIDDVADALCAAIERSPSGRRTVDIGSGYAATVLEVAQLLAQMAGAPPPVVSQHFRDGDVRAASCDIADAQQDLGYQPAWHLRRGLQSLLDWIGTQRIGREAS